MSLAEHMAARFIFVGVSWSWGRNQDRAVTCKCAVVHLEVAF